MRAYVSSPDNASINYEEYSSVQIRSQGFGGKSLNPDVVLFTDMEEE